MFKQLTFKCWRKLSCLTTALNTKSHTDKMNRYCISDHGCVCDKREGRGRRVLMTLLIRQLLDNRTALSSVIELVEDFPHFIQTSSDSCWRRTNVFKSQMSTDRRIIFLRFHRLRWRLKDEETDIRLHILMHKKTNNEVITESEANISGVEGHKCPSVGQSHVLMQTAAGAAFHE